MTLVSDNVPHCSYVNHANFSQASRGFVSDSWPFLYYNGRVKLLRKIEPTSVSQLVNERQRYCTVYNRTQENELWHAGFKHDQTKNTVQGLARMLVQASDYFITML